MRRLLSTLVLAFCSQGVFAEPATDACRNAIAALDAQDSADARAPRREMLRRQAAQACLGGRAEAPLVRPQSLITPISVAPVAPVAPASVTRLAPAAAPMPRPRPPTVLTNCDPNGCWTSDGTRLNRIGPDLVGAGGLCSVTGASVSCP